ncbi:hypothetical protein LTR53_004150 [Teratosphaeriaceae sp. CCFEE 6253]|nr:hypothetical protein LTR53_004150 [Teratosphaeriaceae sp. CCFEE 6253]
MIYDLVAHGQIYGRKRKSQRLANRSVQLKVETIESQAATIAQQEGIIDDLRRQLSMRDALLLSLIQLTEQIADKDTELASLAREHSATARESVAEEGGDADIDISDDDMISIDAAPVHRLEHLMDELMRGLVARQKGSRTQREVVLRPLAPVTVDHQCAQQKRHRPLRYCARCSASAPADSLKDRMSCAPVSAAAHEVTQRRMTGAPGLSAVNRDCASVPPLPPHLHSTYQRDIVEATSGTRTPVTLT